MSRDKSGNQREGAKVRIEAGHTTESVLADALQMVGEDVTRLKAGEPTKLDHEKAKRLAAFVDLVLRISKDQREKAYAQNLQSLKPHEFDELLKEAAQLEMAKKLP